MPTSSQALAYLKHVTDSTVGGQALSAASVSACQLPDVFSQRYEDKEETDSTSQDGLRILGEVLQQRPQRRSWGSEFVLPPINRSLTQPVLSVTSESRKIADTTCSTKQPTRKGWKEGSEDSAVTSVENCNNVGINSDNDPQIQQDEEAETTKASPQRTCINMDLPKAGLGDHDSAFLPSSNNTGTPVSGWNLQQSMATSEEWPQEDTSQPHDVNDVNCKKTLLTSVLNLNLWNQSCETHCDDSSCIGVLSYNHQMGRHEWNLVPQNSPIPFRTVRGRYIKCRNTADTSAIPTLPDQSGNFNDGSQLKQESGADIWTEPGVTELFNSLEEEEEMRKEEEEEELSEHENTDTWPAHDPDAMHAYSTHFQFASALSKQDYQQPKSSYTVNSIRLLPKQPLSDRLKPSGIIYNESYYFEDDAEDIIPRFLETLISAPKLGEDASQHDVPDVSEEDYSWEFPSTPILKCRSFKVASRPPSVQKKKDKVQLPAHKMRPRKFNMKSREPSESVQGKSQSPEHKTRTYHLSAPVHLTGTSTHKARPRGAQDGAACENCSKAREQVDKLDIFHDPGVGDNDAVVETETSIQLSTPVSPRVLRMRTELPPSQPNRLCFRTTLSGCSHNEVINGIESQKNVKVTWLQYEPISLHYTDVAKPEYRHLSMWLFEVSSDSDSPRLLLEGFRLRGQHMNVLHLDDVYLEEFRTFNMCNEILMEQRSKHLIKNKPKRLLKSSPTM